MIFALLSLDHDIIPFNSIAPFNYDDFYRLLVRDLTRHSLTYSLTRSLITYVVNESSWLLT